MSRLLLRVLGVVLALVGLLWALQGIGVIGGSMMSGSKMWLVIGVVVLAIGASLLGSTLRARKP